MVPRLTDLTPSETTDLFLTTQKVERMLSLIYFNPSSPYSVRHSAKHIKSGSKLTSEGKESSVGLSESEVLQNGGFNVAIQDGVHAGQTVPHVHVHIIPRVKGNTEGDGIYAKLQGEEGNVGGAFWDKEVKLGERPRVGRAFEAVSDEDRHVRDDEEMNAEARMFEAGMRELDERDRGEGNR
jgi:bis(5'-adenosyl)-triphosphatase